MKLINVLSILFFFAVTSCSMEDSMMSDTEKEMPVASDNQMVLSFTLNGGTTTKATGVTENPTTDEAAIKNCIIFLLDNSDNVIGVTEKPAETMDMKILTKVRTGLKAVAIVNADNSKFKSCVSMAKINEVLVETSIDEFDKFGVKLVKTGITTITIPDGFKGSSSTTQVTEGVDKNTITVTIPVKQRAARIELSAFSVSYKDETGKLQPIASTYTFVMLSNVKIDTYAFDEVKRSTCSKKIWTAATTPVFYAYQNTNGNAIEDGEKPAMTIMTIRYMYNDKEKTIEFPIKTPSSDGTEQASVIAGNSYKINVNLTLTSVDVDAVVKYEVLPFTSVDVTVPDFN